MNDKICIGDQIIVTSMDKDDPFYGRPTRVDVTEILLVDGALVFVGTDGRIDYFRTGPGDDVRKARTRKELQKPRYT